MPTNELCLDDFWNIKEALVVQDSFDIILNFWVFGLGFLNLFIFIL